ncbi:unnamed protein product [Soboliphyme baturini]|uniref:Cyclin N-terminal domain-containing protein n=1 Tax=Soboliphyme baturini TaxID=241478 RepID=A0A183IVH8_9BILA|nr:unnamed protein product [Soboliphyme baturini]
MDVFAFFVLQYQKLPVERRAFPLGTLMALSLQYEEDPLPCSKQIGWIVDRRKSKFERTDMSERDFRNMHFAQLEEPALADEYCRLAVKFLQEYRWVFDFKWIDFFTESVWERVPPDVVLKI